MNKRIVGLFLPPSFPAFMVPENENRFLTELIGMELADAFAVCAQRGLQPVAEPFSPELSARLGISDMHHLTLVFDGLVVPFSVLLGEIKPKVLH